MPATALVIGYGNSLRGDDALGLVVADRLARSIRSDRVEVLARPLLAPDLAENLAAVDLAIFVDASAETGPPGARTGPPAVRCQQLVADAGAAASLSHHMTPSRLLTLAEVLYQRCPTAYLVTCRGDSFELGRSTLTPAVQAAVQPIADRVCALIEQELKIRLVRPTAGELAGDAADAEQ